jgi:tRNA A37 methylthiotransferase MiaB
MGLKMAYFGFDNIGAFPYSDEEGTPTSDLTEQNRCKN